MDEAVHVLLKGHLLIEEALNRILEQYVFHREHLEDARLTFNQKVLIGRSLALRKNNIGEWELIAAINTLRNELAHRLNSPERERKLKRVKELYFREAAGFPAMEEVKAAPDAHVLMNACGHCAGFLLAFEEDSKMFRRMIHGMDRASNPDQPPFDL
ncbi:hypothetical protein H8N03_25870 [Ramlibacter sp. USB13]|uniref:Uncharacterized protein n=1 Tax=Ramlibacter cellulosilyticus TaxID=2764187 RepID=A0A923MV25_9BURK|nr:hypothetical protein [Ramlibacter cellulosilyticus]